MNHPFEVEEEPSIDSSDVRLHEGTSQDPSPGHDTTNTNTRRKGREAWRNAVELTKGVTKTSPKRHTDNTRSTTVFAVEELTGIRGLPRFTDNDNDDDNDYGLVKIARLILGRRLLSFAYEASVVGLVFLVKPSSHSVGSMVRRVMWAILLLTGVVVMGIQIQGRISYYTSYPTTVKYQLAYNASLHFPTVTVCMENRLRKQVLAGLGPTAPDVVSKVMPPIPDVNFSPDYKSFDSTYWDVNWEDLYRLMAPPMKEVLLQCTFKGRSCKLKEAMSPVSTDMGFCFSFNSESNYVTTETGANNGLRLVLWTNQTDYQVTWSPAAGFRILLHDPFEAPLMRMRGFRVSPGKTTVASFTFRNVSQLPAPYGICNGQANYTFNSCMDHCEGNYILNYCKCRLAESPVNGPVCNPELVFECALNMTKWFISSGDSRKCDCPLQCNQRLYPYSISTSPVSNLFLDHYASKTSFDGRKLNMSKLQREIAFVDIFFSKLTYANIQTIPAYNILGLFADVGCSLGLILGSTVLTVFEIVQFLFGFSADVVVTGRFAHMQKSAKKVKKNGRNLTSQQLNSEN